MSKSQKVALVTGASRGIGKAISIGLAEMGYKVALTGRNKRDLESVAQEIKNCSAPAPLLFQLDIGPVGFEVEDYPRVASVHR